jgi:hypothetical protein
MSPRQRGRSVPQAKPQKTVDRQAQIREQIRAGVHRPGEIAERIGLRGAEGVMYHARQMADVEQVKCQPSKDVRWHFLLQLRATPADQVAAA